jgi:Kae1-associated kinase Bud32
MSTAPRAGAEAVLTESTHLGHDAITKTRLVKGYRHPELDERIRRQRLRQEATLLQAARQAGVPTPAILGLDERQAVLHLRRLAGPTLAAHLLSRTPTTADHLRQWGRLIGRLHAHGLVHGDLTTSNAILERERLWLIDFGLGMRSQDVEDLGVDLLMAQKTLMSDHPARHEDDWGHVLAGYKETMPRAEGVLLRMDEIRRRARYQ